MDQSDKLDTDSDPSTEATKNETASRAIPAWIAIVLSVAALTVSVVLAVVARSDAQALQSVEDHRRLRELTAELAALQVDFAEGNDTVGLAAQIRLSESVELAERLGDRVLTAERIALAFALMGFAENGRLADEMLGKAYASATTSTDRVLVLRTRASVAFALQEPAAGRDYIEQALAVPTAKELGSPLLVNSVNALTRLAAMDLELIWNGCSQAREHASAYRVLFDRLATTLDPLDSMPSPEAVDLRAAACR
jgi:hypothetical protein